MWNPTMVWGIIALNYGPKPGDDDTDVCDVANHRYQGAEALSECPRPARSVLYLHAKPGMRDALVDVFRRIDVPGHALQQAGCLSVEVQVPPDADGPLLVTALWSDRAAYEGWLSNPWREESGNELAPFLEEETAAGAVYDIVLAAGDVSAVAAGAPGVTGTDAESG